MTITTSDYMRIMENNFAELIGTSINFSSEMTSYPATNAVTRFRSEQYRAGGNFKIDSSNSALYIEVSGQATTVELTSGNYTYNNLIDHIQTQLNAYSSGGWLCSYDTALSTYRFNIRNSNTVTLCYSKTTNSVWNTIGHTATTDSTQTSFWSQEQRNHSEEWLTFDIGYNAEIKAFFCIGRLDEAFSISSDATILLKGNNINEWSSPPLSIDLSGYRTDKGIHCFIDSLHTDTRYRFWQFFVQDKLNPLGPEECIKISNIYLGDYVSLSSRNLGKGFNKTVVDPSVQTESEGGNIYYDSKTKYTTFSNVGYGVIDKTDRETLENVFKKMGVSDPMYISLDPNLKISSSLDDLTVYGVYEKSPTMQHVFFDKFNYDIQFREIL